MKNVNDDKFRLLVSQLNELAPREGAIVRAEVSQPEIVVSANKLGYLRLGIEFVKMNLPCVGHEFELQEDWDWDLPLREPPTPKRSKYIFGNAVILLVVILSDRRLHQNPRMVRSRLGRGLPLAA